MWKYASSSFRMSQSETFNKMSAKLLCFILLKVDKSLNVFNVLFLCLEKSNFLGFNFWPSLWSYYLSFMDVSYLTFCEKYLCLTLLFLFPYICLVTFYWQLCNAYEWIRNANMCFAVRDWLSRNCCVSIKVWKSIFFIVPTTFTNALLTNCAKTDIWCWGLSSLPLFTPLSPLEPSPKALKLQS